MSDTAVVLGADGCPGDGWVVAQVPAGGGSVRWHVVTGAAALLALADDLGAAALALDVPIGLPEAGTRPCDVEARRQLPGRASSVFAAPPRGALACSTYAEARRHLPSLSAQTFALVPRIRDVDQALRDAGPQVHRRAVECHPEVAFARLSGLALPRKRSARGALLRLRALQEHLGPVPADVPDGPALDDALDALACAWTARRWHRGEAQVLGGGADALGVPMRIVV